MTVLKFVGAAAGIIALGIGAIWIFNSLWVGVGLGAAIAVVVGGLLWFAWRKDKQARESRAGLERV